MTEPSLFALRTKAQFDRMAARDSKSDGGRLAAADVDFKRGNQVWVVVLPESPAGTGINVEMVTSNKGVVTIAGFQTVRSGSCLKGDVAKRTVRPAAWIKTQKISGRPQLRLLKRTLPC